MMNLSIWILFFVIGSNLFFLPAGVRTALPCTFNQRFRQSLPAEEHETLLQK